MVREIQRQIDYPLDCDQGDSFVTTTLAVFVVYRNLSLPFTISDPSFCRVLWLAAVRLGSDNRRLEELYVHFKVIRTYATVIYGRVRQNRKSSIIVVELRLTHPTSLFKCDCMFILR